MKTITAYRCDHCSRVNVTKRAMEKHESRCIRSPVVRTCATCEHDKHGPDCLESARPRGKKIVFLCQQWEPAEGYATDEHQIRGEAAASDLIMF